MSCQCVLCIWVVDRAWFLLTYKDVFGEFWKGIVCPRSRFQFCQGAGGPDLSRPLQTLAGRWIGSWLCCRTSGRLDAGSDWVWLWDTRGVTLRRVSFFMKPHAGRCLGSRISGRDTARLAPAPVFSFKGAQDNRSFVPFLVLQEWGETLPAQSPIYPFHLSLASQ